MLPFNISSLRFLKLSLVSPFNADSSTLTPPSIIIPSAGTKSPLSKYTKSFTTISLIKTLFKTPFLLTLTYIFIDSSCNFLKAFSLPYSLIVEINDAKNTAISIPKVSNQSKFLNKNTTLTDKAIKRILIIGSPKDSIKSDKKLLCLASLTTLLPYFFLLFNTSLSLSPFSPISILLNKLMIIINY